MFTLLDQLLPDVAFSNSYLGLEQNLQIVTACFHQGSLGHTARTSERHVPKSLHKYFNRLSLLLLCCQASWHGNLQIIFEEACKEKLFQITPVLDGVFGEFYEPFKGESFQSADEQMHQDGIICYYISCLRLEVLDMLVR